jgi:hypothetical protein
VPLTVFTVSAADCVYSVSWLLFTELAADCVGLFVRRDFWPIFLQCLLPAVSPADCVYFFVYSACC